MARLGLGRRWRCAWANDVDPAKAEVYASWFADAGKHLLVQDVATVTPQQLLSASRPGDPPRMAWASFPCQDLSLAGWGRGLGDRRSGTFWAFWGLMAELMAQGRRPPMVVLENVVGLLRPVEFAGLAEALADLGLRFGALVVDAVRFLPQSRPRVFVVAVDSRIDLRPWTSPEPQAWWSTAALLRTHASLSDELKRQWVWWRLAPPPDPASRPALSSLIDPAPEDAAWNSEAETAYLISLMNDRHQRRLAKAQRCGALVGTLYRRTRGGRQQAEVRFDGIAGCLRTPQGGSSRQTLIDLRSGVPRTRLVTARETARLMGVPDDRPLPERYNQAYKAMGDGVAVPAVRHLAEHLLTPLADSIANGDALIHADRLTTPRSAVGGRSAERAQAWAKRAISKP